MSRFHVLAVCVGNVCRSPLAELLLRDRLPADSFAVSSAGIGALVGSSMEATAAEELARLGVASDGFVAQQVTPAHLREADLVLTATAAIRSRVLEEAPSALRRAFTLREFAFLLDTVDAAGHDPADIVAVAARSRSHAAGLDLDVDDPYRQGEAAHARAAVQIDEATRQVASGLMAASRA